MKEISFGGTLETFEGRLDTQQPCNPSLRSRRQSCGRGATPSAVNLIGMQSARIAHAMEAIAISFARSKNDLVLTCNLDVWQRLRNRFGYREKDHVELSHGIMMRAEVTVFCDVEGFCPECSTFPDTHRSYEAEPAMLEIAGKRLVLTISEYENKPLKLFSTGNYGFFIEHYGLSRQGKASFDLKAWISFRTPAPVIKDERIWTPGALGSQFESNRKKH